MSIPFLILSRIFLWVSARCAMALCKSIDGASILLQCNLSATANRWHPEFKNLLYKYIKSAHLSLESAHLHSWYHFRILPSKVQESWRSKTRRSERVCEASSSNCVGRRGSYTYVEQSLTPDNLRPLYCYYRQLRHLSNEPIPSEFFGNAAHNELMTERADEKSDQCCAISGDIRS